jgi:hypothetical protein
MEQLPYASTICVNIFNITNKNQIELNVIEVTKKLETIFKNEKLECNQNIIFVFGGKNYGITVININTKISDKSIETHYAYICNNTKWIFINPISNNYNYCESFSNPICTPWLLYICPTNLCLPTAIWGVKTTRKTTPNPTLTVNNKLIIK